MYVRAATFEAVNDVDTLVARLASDALPRLTQAKGFKNIVSSTERVARRVAVLTTWETEQDLDATEAGADEFCRQALQAAGGRVLPFQRFELLHEELGDKPPAPGCALVVTRTKMDPANIESNLAVFRSKALPAMKASAGFRFVRSLINRQTGEGRVGTVWDDDLCLEQWLAHADQVRANLSSVADIGLGERVRCEVVFTYLG